MSLVLDEHRQYLADAARVSAFRQAIEEIVTPGDVVLDLGAGTGILGLMACRAGAKRVYVVLADQIGRFGLESGILEYFGDARARFLKPDGLMVPSEIRLVVAPVE